MIEVLKVKFAESLKKEYYPQDKLKILSYKLHFLKEIEPSTYAQLNHLYVIYREAGASELATTVKGMLKKIDNIRKKERENGWKSASSTPVASPLPASPPSNSPGPSSVTATPKPI